MSEQFEFSTRDDVRAWLQKYGLTSDGIWICFDKSKDASTISASVALEEVLCFGWIDGQMKKIDDKTYLKYFSLRRKNSKWSEKNKALAMQLEARGRMCEPGRLKIAEAKENGQWDVEKEQVDGEEKVAMLSALLKKEEQAYRNFQAMSPSVKRTYTRAYMDAKTEAGRAKRFAWIVDRLNQNLKPM